MNKRGQVIIFDFIIGFMIFAIGAILASRFIISSVHENDFSTIRSNSGTVSEYLLSEGVPSNWTNETVIKIGLTSGGRLNKTKLSRLYNMSYTDTKSYLSTDYDYFLFFQQNNSVMNITGCGFGGFNITNCTIDVSGLSYDNLVRIGRFVVYNSSIIEMVLYLWD